MAQDAPVTEGEKPEAKTDEPESKETPPTPLDAAQGQTFDKEYVKQLRSEAAQRRTENQQLKERLEELEERDKSELEKATGKLSKAEQRAADAEAKLLRYEVAKEVEGFPAEAVDFLQGKTREELEASAEKLLNLVKSRNDDTPKPDFDGGAREPAEDTDPNTAHNRFITDLLHGNNS